MEQARKYCSDSVKNKTTTLAPSRKYSPSELYLLDVKDGVTFFPLAPSDTAPDWLPHAKVIGVESDREFGVAVLKHLFAEFSRRAAIIKPYGDNIATYRRHVPDARMPRILAVIDEFQVLFEDDDPITDRAVQLLERLARKGRAYGVHLVLASQTISEITALMAKADGIFSQFHIVEQCQALSTRSGFAVSRINTTDNFVWLPVKVHQRDNSILRQQHTPTKRATKKHDERTAMG